MRLVGPGRWIQRIAEAVRPMVAGELRITASVPVWGEGTFPSPATGLELAPDRTIQDLLDAIAGSCGVTVEHPDVPAEDLARPLGLLAGAEVPPSEVHSFTIALLAIHGLELAETGEDTTLRLVSR